MDCSPPGSSIHGIFQARVLQWGAIAFSTTPLKLLSQNQITVTLLNPVVNSNAHFGLNELILVSRIVYLIPWVHAKLLQSHPTLCDPIDCSPPCSSVHGISQTRILKWVAISFSRGIFLTQGLNLGLPPCRQIVYQLSHQGSTYLAPMQMY